jgi:iron complex outermembrane receptor protein
MTLKMKRLTTSNLATMASPAYAEQQKHHFDIPPQSLGSALQTLAAQSGAPMLYAEQTAAGKQSRRLSGDYTTAEAADKLLADSGLVHSVAENGTVTVKPAESTSPATLKSTTVIGKSEDDPRAYTVTNASSATRTDTPIKETLMSIQVIPRAVIDDQQNITVEESYAT